jgi:hypothetical protein
MKLACPEAGIGGRRLRCKAAAQVAGRSFRSKQSN